MLSTHRTAVLAFTLATTCTACEPRADEPGARPVSTRTDSAGVEIVFSEVPLAGAPVYAVMDSTPSLRLGSVDGSAEEQFGSIRGMASQSDGGIAVLDQQAAQVRRFGPDGAYLGSLGSRGEGPGELMRPDGVARLHGDTLAVYDWQTRRVTRYPMEGGDPDVHTLQGEAQSRPNVVSFFSDGRLAGSARWFTGGGTNVPREGEDVMAVDSAVIALYSDQGEIVDTVAVIPNRESIQKWMRAGGGINVLVANVAFARSGVFAAHPDGVWAGFGDRWELRLYGADDGSLLRIIRAPGLEQALTDEEVEAVHRAALARDSTPAQRERRGIWWDLSPRPEVRPTYDRILVDDQAHLWLREWPGSDERPQRWWVFQREGDLLGYVDTPVGVTLMALSGDAVWGVVRDDLDVQYVVRYSMTVVEPQ